jgi:hypothetical protein
VLGGAVGAIAVWLGLPLLRDSLFGVTPTDPWTFAAILMLLAVVTVVASGYQRVRRREPIRLER